MRPSGNATDASEANDMWGLRIAPGHGVVHGGGERRPRDRCRCTTNSSASSTTAYNTGRPSTRPRHSRHRYSTWPSAALRPRILTTPHRVVMCDRKRDSVSRQ